MNFFLKFLFFLTWCVQAYALPFTNLVFFGDSLSDNGNLYQLSLNLIPKSPPYYEGRFTNGFVWPELVSKFYYDLAYLPSKNYAFGGATALFHLPSDRFVSPTNLELEVTQYLTDSLFKDRSHTVFFTWIGGNDYLFDSHTDVNLATSKVTNAIAININKLINNGGKYFIIFNLPDLSKIPYAKEEPFNQLQAFSMMHNEKLAQAIKKINEQHPDVIIVFINVFDIFNDVMTNPEKYNKKYHMTLKNVTDACWPGNVWFKKLTATSYLEKDLQQALIEQNSKQSRTNLAETTKWLINSPAINESYRVSKLYGQGMSPCDHPNEHIFWDHIHPTAAMHNMLAQIVLEIMSTL